MGSLVVFHTETKTLLTCLKETSGTTFSAEAVALGMGADPSEHTGVRIPENLNRYEFRDQMFISETGDVLPRQTIEPMVSKSTVIADGTDVVAITNLPTPCTVFVSGIAEVVDDGALEMTFDLAGDYLIIITSPRYITREITIHATN
jgi:hypothetical protein